MAGKTGGSAIYLNVSSGKLVNKEKGLSYYAYEGRLFELKEKDDEYQGKQIKKVQLKIKDDAGEVVIVTFTKDTWFSHSFFSRISKVDLAKPFELGCSQSDKNEKVSFCWMKQGGEIVKKTDGFAPPDKSPDGKHTDWTKPMEIFDNIIKGLQEKFSLYSTESEPPITADEGQTAPDLPQ